MIQLTLMLAAAMLMALWREPLGRALVALAERVRWKQLAVLAAILFLVWISLHNVQANIAAPMTGDSLAALFDAFAYQDLLIGVTLALLSRQARDAVRRLVDRVRLVVVRVTGRARRIRPAAKPRRTPPKDEPEPVWAFA